MAIDDQRVAATLKTTLACAVIAAAFAAVAVQAAVAVFVLDKRQHLAMFYVWALCSTACLLISAICGSKGVAAVYKGGYSTTWGATDGKGFFSAQAGLGFLGMLLILFSTLCGESKPEPGKEPPDYPSLKANVAKLQTKTVELQNNLATETIELESLKKRVSHLSSSVRTKHRRRK